MSKISEQKRRWKRNLALLFIPALISAFAVFLMWQSHPETEYWIGLLQEGRSFLEAHPWALIALLATLPGIGFPISPIFVLFGVVLAPRYGMPMTLALPYTANLTDVEMRALWLYLESLDPMATPG